MSSEMATNTIGQQAVAQFAQQLVAQIRAIFLGRNLKILVLNAVENDSTQVGGMKYEC